MVITIACPSCSASFPVDPNKIPEAGVNARCSSCGHIFRVERPAPAHAEAPTVDEPAFTASIPEPEPEPEPGPDASFGDGSSTATDEGIVDAPDEWVIETEDPIQSGELEVAPMGEMDDPVAGGTSSFFGSPTQIDEVPPVEDEVDDLPTFGYQSEDAAASFSETADADGDDLPSFGEAPAEDLPSFSAQPEPEAVDDLPSFADETADDLPSFSTEPAEDLPAFGGGVVEEAPAPEPPAAPVAAFMFGKRDPKEKARRLARVLVSDMISYNAQRHVDARARGTIKEDFEDEINKSWKEYVDQVGPEMAEGEGQDFWRDALNDVLTKGESLF